MSQTNQNNNHETRFTKIFVGNLTWRTTSDDLRKHFERYGEVIDANVVCETYPGRSKGYGFVVFRDADSAIRALENPKPVIDGRTTNCNLASLGRKTNMNHPNKNESLNQARPPYQYQPQYVIPYCPPAIWDPVLGQYLYMYYHPFYPYPTQMIQHHFDFTYMTQHSWMWHQRNTYVPQRLSIRYERISEIDQELTADIAYHDNDEEVVTNPESDVD